MNPRKSSHLSTRVGLGGETQLVNRYLGHCQFAVSLREKDQRGNR